VQTPTGLKGIEVKLRSAGFIRGLFPPTLARGSTGSVALQQALKAFGATTDPGPIDGDFGRGTESAARAYQSQQNNTVEGVLGIKRDGFRQEQSALA
jgi:peptidoglycan hydrolase-like protein with peptidoglycan-binding domain